MTSPRTAPAKDLLGAVLAGIRPFRRMLLFIALALAAGFACFSLTVLAWFELSQHAREIRAAVGHEVIFRDGQREHTGVLERAEYEFNDCWGFIDLRVRVASSVRAGPRGEWLSAGGGGSFVLSPWELDAVDTSLVPAPVRAAARNRSSVVGVLAVIGLGLCLAGLMVASYLTNKEMERVLKGPKGTTASTG